MVSNMGHTMFGYSCCRVCSCWLNRFGCGALLLIRVRVARGFVLCETTVTLKEAGRVRMHLVSGQARL